MESPLGPILANISLSYHEENWLNKCAKEFKLTFNRRCADKIFELLESPWSAHSFNEYMSFKHHNINFSVEPEDIGSLPFLCVKTCR